MGDINETYLLEIKREIKKLIWDNEIYSIVIKPQINKSQAIETQPLFLLRYGKSKIIYNILTFFLVSYIFRSYI